MNTEATQDNTASSGATPGERLRQARERLGLTQQVVAERLCLKISTVRELEENSTSTDLAPTFLRGYIRSYAKLVHVPEEEVLPMLAPQAASPTRAANVAPLQSLSLGKSRNKKRDGWLMSFTWLILLVVLGLTVAWWWQNHQAQQQEINSMVANTAGAQSGNGQAVELNGSDPEPVDTSDNADGNNAAAAPDATANNAPVAQPQPVQPQSVAPALPPVNQNASTTDAASAAATPAAEAAPANPNAIAMTFTADCWLEVVDSAGKKLFSGLQRNGGTLNLNGQPPYRLKIGAPAAVQIQYQGKPVDLSRFIRSNQVARLTLAAQ